MWTHKNGGHLAVFSLQKCNVKPKFANFTWKLQQKCPKGVQICNLYVKFDTKVEKRESLGVDWRKKGVHWV